MNLIMLNFLKTKLTFLLKTKQNLNLMVQILRFIHINLNQENIYY